MFMYWRFLEQQVTKWANKPYVQILFGARQTGKSTLLKKLFPGADIYIDLSNPGERSRYFARPQEFIAECRALPGGKKRKCIIVDEAQTVPGIFDAVQSLYDSDKTRWQFILCGSSARKLRATGTNLLPGRAVYHHLYTLTTLERAFSETTTRRKDEASFFPRLIEPEKRSEKPFPAVPLEERLAFGELPGIAVAAPEDRPDLLRSYALIYLEEEIRREGLVKDWGAFVRFLELAAAESGGIVNYSSLSRESGVSVATIKSYYRLLEDMFIGFSVPAFSGSTRKYLLSTPKFYFFDNGVRNAAAGLEIGPSIVRSQNGPLFEQWVGQELWKRLGYLKQGRLFHYRTKGGAEIDFVVQKDRHYTPIGIKWTEHPTASDARHMETFLRDMDKKAASGYIICRCAKLMQITDHVKAVPYWWF
jgi:predicted AAA+ superfamily ATPase